MDKQFFDNLKTTIGNTIKTAGEKTNKFVAVKKLEFEIGKVKNEIDKIFRDLGLKIYTVTNNGNGDFGDLNAICNQINSKKEYIKTLERQIEMIQSDDTLKDSPVKYPEHMPEFIKHPESSQNIGLFKFCPDCKTGNEPGNEVCKSCGRKL